MTQMTQMAQMQSLTRHREPASDRHIAEWGLLICVIRGPPCLSTAQRKSPARGRAFSFRV
jgi:hypothetical protein